MKQSLINAPEQKNAAIKHQILYLCMLNGAYSIAELTSEIDASIPTITKFVGELIDEGKLMDLGKKGSARGRRTSTYGLNPEAGYFVGVDVARQHFHICVTDFAGDVVAFIKDIAFVLEPTPDSFKSMCSLTKEMVAAQGVSWDRVLSVGVSLSGRVNPEEGFSLSYFVSDDLPVKDIFAKALGVPVIVENDSRAMTYGEYLDIARTSDEKNMLFINVSWGLGMGMVLDGKLYYGKSGFSGEIGHFPFLENGIICRCGKEGCLETGASGSALHTMITAELAKGRRSSLSKKYDSGEEITLEDILLAVKEEDVLAIEGIENVGDTLGRAIAGLINVFNPGLVVIGGRLIEGKDYLLLHIRSAVNKHSLKRVSSDTEIRFSKLARRAAAIGDCALARAKYLGL